LPPFGKRKSWIVISAYAARRPAAARLLIHFTGPAPRISLFRGATLIKPPVRDLIVSLSGAVGFWNGSKAWPRPPRACFRAATAPDAKAAPRDAAATAAIRCSSSMRSNRSINWQCCAAVSRCMRSTLPNRLERSHGYRSCLRPYRSNPACAATHSRNS